MICHIEPLLKSLFRHSEKLVEEQWEVFAARDLTRHCRRPADSGVWK
jgi:hypothetical protein